MVPRSNCYPAIHLGGAESLPLKYSFRLQVFMGLSLMTGCRSGGESELPGDYLMSTTWGESTLVLRADHSMEQATRTNSGQVKRNSGTWKCSTLETDARCYVMLAPCLEVAEGSGQPPLISQCGLTFEVSALNTILFVDSDQGLSYRKVKRR